MNIIGDLIGTTLGLARNKGLLIADKIVRVDSADTMLQKCDNKAGKNNWKPTIIVTSGNVIAKKIGMGDNFKGYNGFSTETARSFR